MLGHRPLSTSLAAVALLLTACAPAPSPEESAAPSPPPATESPVPTFQKSFADPVEEAFGADSWRSQEAIKAGITVTFGGNSALDGKILFTTNMGKSRLELADGSIAVFDGQQAWVSPAESAFAGARFHLLTWPYFLAVPAKLKDPGTHLEDLGPKTLGESTYDSARLTFDSGVGDAPDDWYVLYREAETGRLAAMAYIVTFGNSLEEAQKEPHAITYGDLQTINGVKVPHHWQFWLWNEEQGIHGDPIGEVRLRDVRFMTPMAEAFAKPNDAREDTLPGAG